MYCQTLKEFKELKGCGTFTIEFLWKPDGSQAAAIRLLKQQLNDSEVFHLYNFLDSSKAHNEDSGCRINPWDEPFLSLDDALAAGEQIVEEALRSDEWVRKKDIK